MDRANFFKRTSTFIEKQDLKKLALIIFCVTFFLEVLLSLFLISFLGVSSGTVEYETIAKNIAAGNGFVFKEGEEFILWRPPLYIYILALFYYFFSNPYLIIVLLQLALCSFTCVVVFYVGAGVFDKTTAFISSVILSLFPLFMFNGIRLMPEMLFAFFLAIIVLLTREMISEPTKKKALITGIVLGITTLTKASMQFYTLFLLLLVILFMRDRKSRQNYVINIMLTTVVMVVAILPWSIRNYQVSNEFIFLDTSGGYTFWIGNRLETNGLDDDPLTREDFIKVKKEIAEILDIPYTSDFDVSKTAWASKVNSSKLYREGIKNILENPFNTSILWIKKLYRFWFSYIGKSDAIRYLIIFFQVMVLIPAVYGIYIALKNGKRVIPFIIIILYFTLLHMAATASARYSAPIIPYIILLAVYGIQDLIGRFSPQTLTIRN